MYQEHVSSFFFSLQHNMNLPCDSMGSFCEKKETKGNTGHDSQWRSEVKGSSVTASQDTVRCFPSSGFLPFRWEGQFAACLLMWKYRVYMFKCVCGRWWLLVRLCVQGHVFVLPPSPQAQRALKLTDLDLYRDDTKKTFPVSI